MLADSYCLVCLQDAHDNRLGAEFKNEIRTMASIEHLNLVQYFGYLEHEDERIIVIEYVPNGTLREHLDCKLIFKLHTASGFSYVGLHVMVIMRWTWLLDIMLK